MKTIATVEAYRDAIRAAGGLDALTVLSCYTFIDDPRYAPGRHIYTEWGTRDGAFVAESEEHDGVYTYRVAMPHKSESTGEKR